MMLLQHRRSHRTAKRRMAGLVERTDRPGDRKRDGGGEKVAGHDGLFSPGCDIAAMRPDHIPFDG
jgi:hypothetical protein